MPHIEVNSEIIPVEKFELLWEWLPAIYRISDPTLIFQSTKDGFFLQNLYVKLKEYDNLPMLLLFKTDENIVIIILFL